MTAWKSFVDMAARDLASPDAASLVGAGASAGAGLPTWPQIIDQLRLLCPPPFHEGLSQFVRDEKFAEAAQLAQMALPPETWTRAFEAFDTHGILSSTWNTLSHLGIPKIVTTNWDNISEDSFAK